MNLDTIRKMVSLNLNKKMSFIYKGSRGQVEKFEGIITELYPRVFIVKQDNDKKMSFSYSDVAINNIKMY